jgi:ADP-heptose:LPS heptosyltransferase
MFGRKSENILVVKTDGLASFVSAEPVFKAIRDAYPKAKISLITRPSMQRIARAAPYFDQVAALPNLSESETKRAFIRQLQSQKFAQVFDLSADEDARKLQAAFGPFGPKWQSAAPPSRRRRGPDGDIPGYAKLLSGAGIAAEARLPDFTWALAARKDSANMQPSWFGISGVYGLLLPGPDPEQRWPASNYAGLAQTMARAHIMPVLAGGKELHSFGDEIAHEAPEIVDLSGKTDHLQLVALAQDAAFFVTDHAEEVHLALSVGCKGVMIRKSAMAYAPEGRNIVMVTSSSDLGAAKAELVWRTLQNMGLIPDPKSAKRAAPH